VTKVEAIADLLKPFDARLMRAYPVSSRVNHVQNDDAECCLPIRGNLAARKAISLTLRIPNNFKIV